MWWRVESALSPCFSKPVCTSQQYFCSTCEYYARFANLFAMVVSTFQIYATLITLLPRAGSWWAASWSGHGLQLDKICDVWCFLPELGKFATMPVTHLVTGNVCVSFNILLLKFSNSCFRMSCSHARIPGHELQPDKICLVLATCTTLSRVNLLEPPPSIFVYMRYMSFCLWNFSNPCKLSELQSCTGVWTWSAAWQNMIVIIKAKDPITMWHPYSTTNPLLLLLRIICQFAFGINQLFHKVSCSHVSWLGRGLQLDKITLLCVTLYVCGNRWWLLGSYRSQTECLLVKQWSLGQWALFWYFLAPLPSRPGKMD